jgi:hypothetical protein
MMSSFGFSCCCSDFLGAGVCGLDAVAAFFVFLF